MTIETRIKLLSIGSVYGTLFTRYALIHRNGTSELQLRPLAHQELRMADRRYSFRVLWSEEDQDYVALCPEFQGLSGLAETPEQAIAELQTALDLAIETYADDGTPLPEPAMLRAFSGQFRLRVPSSLHALLTERAADEGVSLNTYAVTLLAAGLSGDRAAKQVQQSVDALIAQLRGDPYPAVLANKRTVAE